MFKRGDIIRTKRYTHCCSNFRFMTQYMEKYCGRHGVIIDVEDRRYEKGATQYPDGKAYRIQFYGCRPGGNSLQWVWNCECLEHSSYMIMETE